MTFTLLPAIDVSGGRAVRLGHGPIDAAATPGSPLETALGWQSDGAAWIHLVDLDAAFGRGSNAELLADVIGALDVDVELAGGICDQASLERALSTGCGRVVLSTAALADLAWCARVVATHGDRIAIGLDVRIDEMPDASVQHRLAVRGTNHDAADGSAQHRLGARCRTHQGSDLWDTLAELDRAGGARYVVTDVSKDGLLGGPNVELYRAVTATTSAPVIASGGVGSIDDLILLAEVAATGANLEGSIVGKALHAGRFTLPQALESTRRFSG